MSDEESSSNPQRKSSFFQNFLKNTEKTISSISKDINRNFEKHVARSTIVNMLTNGAIIQLISKQTNQCLSCYPNTGLDAKGTSSSKNPWTQFKVKKISSNMIFLRNLGLQQENSYLTIYNGTLICTGAGDTSCTLVVSESSDHYIRFESRQLAKNYIAASSHGSILPAQQNPDDDCVKFSVKIVEDD